jgi:Spy/CpxP family protein refolding chaperone
MKKITILFITFALALVVAVPSFANFPHFWKDKKIVKELGLSEKQINSIKEYTLDSQKKMIKLHADVELKELDLKELLDSDEPDEDKVVNLIKEVMSIKTEQRIVTVKQKLFIKKTLSDKQIEKLHKTMEEKHKKAEHMPGKGRPLPPGKQGKHPREI